MFFEILGEGQLPGCGPGLELGKCFLDKRDWRGGLFETNWRLWKSWKSILLKNHFLSYERTTYCAQN